MDYKPTLSSAIDYSNKNQLEEWVHLFLRKEGDNVAFSDGLRLEPRRFYAPEMIKLDTFERCCGPEPNMKFRVPEANFIIHVNKMAMEYNSGCWDMPPLIVYRDGNAYELNDGNHRFEALKKLRIKKYWVIIWENII
jgi:hypothetical protein